MALRGIILTTQGVVRCTGARYLSTAPTVCSGKPLKTGEFDTSLGAHGPLIDGPDYSFLNGCPTPLRAGQRRRALEQRVVSAKALQLLKETRFAIEREARTKQEKEEERQRIMDAKLKPKGKALTLNKT
ncbi:hypothetical protein Pcinc_037141 [Petrolisthes cinctipes]|uniref:Large ribosomal subunit protein mL52 n=1 Tax=Petrolisthes cinctipes TaxID=88211 RepID=A0AAE1BU58_PETCI|nr:hypothetical protein Pcinc_037141 [Petrolisthes cinctipes]